jgi:dihydrofolate reductase
MKNFNIIAACDQNFGIGKDNQLPWRLRSELQYFQDTTANSTVIMGRKTWDSLPPKSKPLGNRQNIVISRTQDLLLPEGVLLACSLEEALGLADSENIFVIGGGQLYAESINHPDCSKVYLTQIQSVFDCDAFFPKVELLENFTLETQSNLQHENNLDFYYNIYSRN